MARFFYYDQGKHKHRIFEIPVKNEKDELVGYRPQVHRFDAEKGGIVEPISDQYEALKWKIFSTEKLCRDFAIEFFNNLK
jgi:hypothetical protein